jgi:hypothetical protein
LPGYEKGKETRRDPSDDFKHKPAAINRHRKQGENLLLISDNAVKQILKKICDDR